MPLAKKGTVQVVGRRGRHSDFDALQQAARERLFRDTYKAKTGLTGFIDAIKDKLDLQQLAETTQARKEAADAFVRGQEQDAPITSHA